MRLIDADAFSDFIRKTIFKHGYDALGVCDTLTVGEVLHSVCAELDGTGLDGFKNTPTVDAIEVVRCKDCKHSEHWYRDRRRCFLWTENGVSVFDDGFCNYGERK